MSELMVVQATDVELRQEVVDKIFTEFPGDVEPVEIADDIRATSFGQRLLIQQVASQLKW